MEDGVSSHLVSTNFNDVSQHHSLSSMSYLHSDPSVKIRNKLETATEADDLLKNGILIETNVGVEWISLTEALTRGVGGLNLSVEDFQNVATQLLSSQKHMTVQGGTLHDPIKQQLMPMSERDVTTSLRLIPFKQLESIAETVETAGTGECDDVGGDTFLMYTVANQPLGRGGDQQAALHRVQGSFHVATAAPRTATSTDDSELGSSSATISDSSPNSDSSIRSSKPTQAKKKGGWPKGRKRKPELMENRPPKAPSTGYVFYLNEKRKLFKDTPFPEVTKMLGNEWSKMSLSEKRMYLERAEVDKKRYKEELRIYRKSDAYQNYLSRKRMKSYQANGTEESDIDATDEIDDEDSEELYCRVCDQWFTSLHNKKEHLYGRGHFQSISQLDLNDGSSSLSYDESSLDAAPVPRTLLRPPSPPILDPTCMTDAIAGFLQLAADREQELRLLEGRLTKAQEQQRHLIRELCDLKQSETRLQKALARQRDDGLRIEQQICDLWDVPSLFLRGDELVSE